MEPFQPQETDPHETPALTTARDLAEVLAPPPIDRDGLVLRDEVWGGETEEFLDRLLLGPGQRVLALGCGLGFDLPRLSRRVGPHGEVCALEPDPRLAFESQLLVDSLRLRNVKVLSGMVMAALPPGPFDVIFSSWFLAQIDNVPSFLRQLRQRISGAGRLGVLDLYPGGLRLFPEAPALERVLVAASQVGQNFWLMGQLPAALVSSGFLLEGAWPRQKAEVPGTATYRWVERFLLEVGPRLVSQELLEENDWQTLLEEWSNRRVDPSTLLFSPQLVGIIGRGL